MWHGLLERSQEARRFGKLSCEEEHAYEQNYLHLRMCSVTCGRFCFGLPRHTSTPSAITAAVAAAETATDATGVVVGVKNGITL